MEGLREILGQRWSEVETGDVVAELGEGEDLATLYIEKDSETATFHASRRSTAVARQFAVAYTVDGAHAQFPALLHLREG